MHKFNRDLVIEKIWGRKAATKRYYEANKERLNAQRALRRRIGAGPLPGEVFDARCIICRKPFQHDGSRVTCSDECRIKKLLRGSR